MDKNASALTSADGGIFSIPRCATESIGQPGASVMGLWVLTLGCPADYRRAVCKRVRAQCFARLFDGARKAKMPASAIYAAIAWARNGPEYLRFLRF